MNEAEACFILAARNYADKTAAVSLLKLQSNSYAIEILFLGRTHNITKLGSERLCPQRGPIRADFPAGKQTSR